MTTVSTEQMQLDRPLDKLSVLTLHGRDRQGHRLLLLLGKYVPARSAMPEALKGYLERRVYPELGKECFSVVYVHAGVPGLSALRSFLDAHPDDVKRRLKTVYFLYPGFQDRLFLATFGRFLFPCGSSTVKYVNRLEYLTEHVRRNEVELPEFVSDFDEELEDCPAIDYGMESDHPQLQNNHYYCYEDTSTVPCYSMGCIA